MNEREIKDWNAINQHYLMAEIVVVRGHLENYRARGLGEKDVDRAEAADDTEVLTAPGVPDDTEVLTAPAAIDVLASAFGLSGFERSILALCAGVELDHRINALIASIEGETGRQSPSFGLALAAFPDAHWSAITPHAALRYWHLIEYLPGHTVTRSPIKINEQILHYLMGINQLNERFKGIVEPVAAEPILVPSQQETVNRILEAYSRRRRDLRLPVIVLEGGDLLDKKTIAVYIAAALDLRLYTIRESAIPVHAGEVAEWARYWNRDAALNQYALFVEAGGAAFVDSLQCVTILGGDAAPAPAFERVPIKEYLYKPTPEEQLVLWKKCLGKTAERLNGQLEGMLAPFDLNARTICAASSEILAQASDESLARAPDDSLENTIWKTCCRHTRSRLEELAQRIEPVCGWEDIVLPATQENMLRELAMQVRQRHRVYREWGFAGKGARGLGISALFTGESGTGKTMASEVLAKELRMDLYRIDLSQVVNKYVGETEKNLKRIFDAAEGGGAILLFDEADALFGKRGEVKDSHDRYGNIEVSYLLQRMEAYRGLAILTTNMKSAMDKAFLRRIRFVVNFPFPDAFLRAEIWRRIFSAHTPTKDLDMEKLARMNIPGGNIRNIAMNAAFMAAGGSGPLMMSHLARAARNEYSKLEKPFSTSEIGTW